MNSMFDSLFDWLLLGDGVSWALGFLVACWLAAWVQFPIFVESELWRPRGPRWEPASDGADSWAVRSAFWFLIGGALLFAVPIISALSSRGKGLGTVESWEAWSAAGMLHGFLVGAALPTLALLLALMRVTAGRSALHVFLLVGLWPWRGLLRFVRRYGGWLAAAGGCWLLFACAGGFWTGGLLLLALVGGYKGLTTTAFGFVWIIFASWFAIAQICGLIVGVWSAATSRSS
jgi:hypothetical protein